MMNRIMEAISTSLLCYTSSLSRPLTLCDIRLGEACSVRGPTYGCSTSTRDEMGCHVSLCNAPMEVLFLIGVLALFLGLVLLTGCCFCCFCCCCGKCCGLKGASICHFCPVHRIYPRPIPVPIERSIHHHHNSEVLPVVPCTESGIKNASLPNINSHYGTSTIKISEDTPSNHSIYPSLGTPSAPPPPPDYGVVVYSKVESLQP